MAVSMQSHAWADGAGQQQFSASCRSFHGARCDVSFQGGSPSRVVDIARKHGALAHGFTPAYYNRARLNGMLALVMGSVG